ncbi:hypothetical protein AC579_2282 [Pseudocercospora musae]|uniref:FAD linked oxidase N-terminal domain-containing protein n=1 Tax=Pseudocercospora musae TaxID=113226 RepID=A0A139IUT8_9PEZI|nr:hypothetical protein AC579_2282 [Pseudocercospora musae]
MACSDLQSRLSGSSRVLASSESEEFQTYMKRWSELNRQTPDAIALPETEEDVAAIVCHNEFLELLPTTNIPFTTKSGGMSLFSTIASNGIIIDLSSLPPGVDINKHDRTANLSGAVTA